VPVPPLASRLAPVSPGDPPRRKNWVPSTDAIGLQGRAGRSRMEMDMPSSPRRGRTRPGNSLMVCPGHRDLWAGRGSAAGLSVHRRSHVNEGWPFRPCSWTGVPVQPLESRLASVPAAGPPRRRNWVPGPNVIALACASVRSQMPCQRGFRSSAHLAVATARTQSLSAARAQPMDLRPGTVCRSRRRHPSSSAVREEPLDFEPRGYAHAQMR
jgi:hypothetical protein